MANKSKDLGTKAETATVRAAITRGFPLLERRQLKGAGDCGDLTGYPQIAWQVKGGHYAWDASDLDIERWLEAAEKQRDNAGASACLLIVQRKRVGYDNAHRWWAYMRASLMTGDPRHNWPVRMLVEEALLWLRMAGYGEPLNALQLEKAS